MVVILVQTLFISITSKINTDNTIVNIVIDNIEINNSDTINHNNIFG